MTEEQVREVAQRHVSSCLLEPCSIEAVRRFNHSEIKQPTTKGDEWVVQFQFSCDDEEGVIANRLIIIVDDATGECSGFESL